MDRNDDFLIQHVNVNVDDLDAAIPFYRDILGLPLDETPDQGFRSQFFRIGATQQQIHMNEMPDQRQFRGHFCLVVPDFMAVFARAKAAGVIDVAPWGKIRQLPNGKMQMFVRDPSGNLIEIASTSSEIIDLAVFQSDAGLVESQRGIYRMAPGASVGRHEIS
ncbi:MAG TPA: VOC family protein [Terriglobia bacterium]|nr:VOC family protein [Terriglobia bacterium]